MNHLDPIQRPKGQANKGKSEYCLNIVDSGLEVNADLFTCAFENLACADAIACLSYQLGQKWACLCNLCAILHLICHFNETQDCPAFHKRALGPLT